MALATIESRTNLFRGKKLDTSTGRRTRTETYRIKMSGKVPDIDTVEFLAGYKEGDKIGNYTITSIGTTPVESNRVFDITLGLEIVPENLHYNSEGSANGVSSFKIGKWFLSRRVDYDTETGDPIVNSANEPFAETTERQIPQMSVIMSIRSPLENLARFDDIGKINDSAFTLGGVEFPKYCGMLQDFDLENFYDDNGNLYHIATYEFRRNLTKNKADEFIGFKAEIRDWGFMHIHAGKQVKTYIQNTIPSAPVLLNSSDGSIKTPIETAEPDYKEFALDPLTDFSAYDLPTDYPLRKSIRQ